MSAGLFTRGIWFLETNTWNQLTGGDSSESGSGPGSYDIRQSVWHVNCCNAQLNGGGGWGIFNAILGWTNSATYGSVIGYNLYWAAVIVWFVAMRHTERYGRVPLIEPLLRRCRARRGPQQDAEENNGAVENAETKAEGPGANFRVNEVTA